MDKEMIQKLITRYTNDMSNPISKEYDRGYIDGVVDTLGDLITFLELDELNEFADAMEELQSAIYDLEEM
jgi:hypothetical protein